MDFNFFRSPWGREHWDADFDFYLDDGRDFHRGERDGHLRGGTFAGEGAGAPRKT